MSTSDILRSDIDEALSGFFSESVEYKSLSGVPESSIDWDTYNAIVEGSAEELGVSANLGRSPIVVVLSKTDISSVIENVDKIRYSSYVYTVAKILSEDAQGWQLYCVP